MSIPTANVLPSQELEVVSSSSKRRGKASRQRRTDAFREVKNKPNLERIHSEMRARTFEEFDTDTILAQLKSISISSSTTEIQVPATTRGAGFLAQSVVEEAAVVAPRAVQASEITPIEVYRVTLGQIACQQSMSYSLHSSSQDEVVADHQPERVSADFVQELRSTTKTFSLLGTVPQSFGKYDENGDEYRTFIPPHPTVTVERPQAVPVDEARRQAQARQVDQMVPNPFVVTIQTLRQVVTALAGDDVPIQHREYFRANNPIPEVIWNDQHQITNADYLCSDNYDTSAMFYRDVRKFRQFISTAGNKMSSLISDIRMDGRASSAMFVTQYHFNADLNNQPRGNLFRCSRSLRDQQFLLGCIPLIGEYPNPLPFTGFGFREPTCSCKTLELNWKATIGQLLVKK